MGSFRGGGPRERGTQDSLGCRVGEDREYCGILSSPPHLDPPSLKDSMIRISQTRKRYTKLCREGVELSCAPLGRAINKSWHQSMQQQQQSASRPEDQSTGSLTHLGLERGLAPPRQGASNQIQDFLQGLEDFQFRQLPPQTGTFLKSSPIPV